MWYLIVSFLDLPSSLFSPNVVKKSLVPDKNFAIDCAGYWDSLDLIGLNLSLPLDISGKWPINSVGI